MFVGADTDVSNLADSIRVGFKDGAPVVELRMIGAAAVNQAVKAVAIVRRHHHYPVTMVPHFEDVEHPEKGLITGMKISVFAPVGEE